MKDTTATLPESWAPATVGEICTALQYGYTASSSDEPCGPRFLRITDIQNGLVQWPSVPYCKIESALTQKYQLHPGDIVFARTGGTVGKSFIISFVPEPSVFASYLIRLSAHSNVEPKYLYYFFQTASYWEQIGLKKGGLQGNVNATTLSSLELPICPLNEQHRIVAKIEELFSELDKGIENLKTARAQLKVYRQALLKYAFEGKLTAQWRAENRDKLETADALLKRIQQERAQRYQQQLADWENSKSPSIPLLQRGKTTSVESSAHPPLKKGGRGDLKPKAPKPLPPLTKEELAELPELPEGWSWARLLEACEAVVDCHNKTAPYQATGIPLVRTPSIRDMKLSFDDSIRYVSQETYEYWSRRCPPLPGDILFTREAPMGEAAIIPDGKVICMGQRIMLLRPGNFLSGKYLLSATQNPIFKRVANKAAVGTGVKHLRVGDVERLVFPLCSVSEQAEIANQLDARLSEVDQLEL